MGFQKLSRKGWVLNCPFCACKVKYTKVANNDPPVPFFYSEGCNDVVLRKSDQKRVDSLPGHLTLTGVTPELGRLWNDIVDSLPEDTQGGRFKLWSNIKCPTCKKEFPYNHGVKNLSVRIYEPEIILIDGANFLGDDDTSSYSIEVTV